MPYRSFLFNSNLNSGKNPNLKTHHHPSSRHPREARTIEPGLSLLVVVFVKAELTHKQPHTYTHHQRTSNTVHQLHVISLT